MMLIIDSVRNGYVVHVLSKFNDKIEDTTVIEGEDRAETAVRMLTQINELIGYLGSRNDARCVFIGLRPGDKHHDFHPQPCSECACACDPDQSSK